MRPEAVPEGRPITRFSRSFIVASSVVTAVVYFFSNPKPHNYYDYTFRVAANLLGGNIGLTEQQPSWLNEMVPFDGVYYSVFPLGAVLSMIPAALLRVAGLISEMPGAWVAAVLGGTFCYFLLKIATRYEISNSRVLVQTAAVLFGSFMWTNLTFAGAWQLALGFAIVGEIGAIYFTRYERRPLIAGMFFALAFGNRTEILLTAPLFFLLLGNDRPKALADAEGARSAQKGAATFMGGLVDRFPVRTILAFCVMPAILGVATLVYNYVRFHSFTDFGYARIPGVLLEPWYQQGIFSLSYLPGQAWEMLFKSWERYSTFPYLRPNGFSATIVWSSPFLLFVLRLRKPRWLQELRRKGKMFAAVPLQKIFSFRTLEPGDRTLRYVSWAAIAILTILLWAHGNSGGWQFGYRYAMVLLPWIFVILLETAPRRITLLEGTAYFFSFAANIYATWLYHWTGYMRP